jgi:DNA (cytosine-5)-methyltransferase 1
LTTGEGPDSPAGLEVPVALAYYNEHDPFAAAWLRSLIEAKEIAPGVVDERSITDVEPQDLEGYTQCHFFAGIGGWSLALRLAGWPDDRPVWTGSCPCQPFSAAGKGRGVDDERHLWPELRRLIGQRRPPVVLGEQVASTAGRAWLDAVRADLEGLGYGVGAADLCAAGVGAPHIRQRLWWGGVGGLADAHGGDAGAGRLQRGGEHRLEQEDGGPLRGAGRGPWAPAAGGVERPREDHAPWRAADWLRCRDDRWRPVEPGTFPLAHGLPTRMGRLRAYGNAIVPQVAAVFIDSFWGAVADLVRVDVTGG